MPGDLLVMLKPDASAQAIATDLKLLNGHETHLRVVQEISAPMRAWLLHYEAPAIPQALMRRAVQGHPAVMLAQDNHRIQERAVPNDSDYVAQWHHQTIASEAAWEVTTGGLTATGDTIVICIIENADLPQPDLVANAWFNRHEIPNNGVDDDGNGYVDDYRGWNPPQGNDNVYGGSHGTQVAGMIGAKGNNETLVVGANWNVKMMAVPYGGTQEAQVIAAYTYPLVMRRLYNATGGDLGAFVVATNASWGIDGGQPEDAPLWCAMYDTLGTAGILNCGATANNAVNVDQVGDLPTACASDFMISVTATNSLDARTFSAWGSTTIDLGAPGALVVTTNINGSDGPVSGTSFASPLTAGVIGLLYSVPCSGMMDLVRHDPSQGARYVRQALFSGVEQVGNLPGNTVTGGRINAHNSVQWIMDHCAECWEAYDLHTVSDAIGHTTLAWNGLSTTYDIRYRVVGEEDWSLLTDVLGFERSLSDLPPCVPFEFQVAPICGGSAGAFSPSHIWMSEGCCHAPLAIEVSMQDTADALVAWNSVLAAGSYSLRYRPIDGSVWEEIGGLESSSMLIQGLEPCTDYEVQMSSTCADSTGNWSATVGLHVPGCGQCIEGDFCESIGNTWSIWLDHVQLGTIDNMSGDNDGYADNSDQSTELITGQGYTITLTPYLGFPIIAYYTIWMDFDRDGQFSAPDELVFSGSSDQIMEGTLTVPIGAPEGSVRMRIVMSANEPVMSGCSVYDFGETEDYCIALTVGTGVAEVDGGEVAVFPNPADAAVSFTAPGGTADLLVLDGAGRQVARQALVNGRLTLATTGWSEGLYVYRLLRNGTDMARGRFVVAH